MPDISAEELARVNSFPKLVTLLRDRLEWPINEDYEFEDVIFEYEPQELGLKEEETAKVREIHQLRPLVTNQPWGVFFISFEEKQLSVAVLRRILRALVVKQRGGSIDRQAWDKSDLIFAANFGKSGEREIAFVHFSDGAETFDLPVMKVLGWNAKDTKLHNDYAAEMLKSRLAWPGDESDVAAWRKQWSSAFEIGHRQVIKTSRDLALHLAGLATQIRARANELLEAEADVGPMRTMLEAFRKNLIHDLDEDGFSDMFAQTIGYGLLAAAISGGPGALVADNMADLVPRTNPFLKELFANFLKLGGRDKRSNLDFDELGVSEVVDMLRSADMSAVLRDFGDRNPKEDPVIHFYELFLKEYDPAKRMQRGVFYTPRPVVNFIVRGVDEILRTRFDLPLGLADTTTWGELAARNDTIAVPNHISPDQPFVQILDPASGTGTFLVEVIDLIHKRMVEYWQGEGKSKDEIAEAWNAYVPACLLPRLTAFELMMAPYAIAHMKVGLKLIETGYKFGSEERARIFLTNALEPTRDLESQFDFISAALAHEAQAANGAKDEACFTAIIGNPPYSISSNNNSRWIRDLLADYKRGLDDETNLQPISDDYVKFFRMAQFLLERSGAGVFSFVSNHTYLSGIILRSMRRALTEFFGEIVITDLHGSVLLGLAVGEGGLDQNVFDIQQGVSVVHGVLNRYQERSVMYGSIIAPRDQKFEELLSQTFRSPNYKRINPCDPNYWLIDRSNSDGGYEAWPSTSEIFLSRSTGLETGKDEAFIKFSAEEIRPLAEALDCPDFCAEDLENDFGITNTSGWNVWRRVVNGRKISKTHFQTSIGQVLYRPFDQRSTIATDVLRRRQFDNLQHLGPWRIGLITTRQIKGEEPAHAFVCEGAIEKILISPKTSNNAFALPLWLRPSAGEEHSRPSISIDACRQFEEKIRLPYIDGIPRGEQKSMGADYRHQKAEQIGLLDQPWDGRGDLVNEFGPRDLFDWIYAILHAPSYRRRYTEYLKSDFPRIPVPKDRDTFAALVPLGRRLVALHLLKVDEETMLKEPDIRFAGTGEARVERGYPKYDNGKVEINANRWFEDVPKETWEFHVGGYQVCEKWLKDRAGKGGANPRPGRILSDDDILHYRRVVTALTETRNVMEEIDKAIEVHGGWPNAFSMATDAEISE